MNILLAGISAKFIHQNLAVDTLRLYAEEQYGISCAAAEYTINQPFDFILGELYRRKPDLLGFSCYLWNWERVRRLSRALKTVLPGTRIVLGGPEVSADPAEALEASGADFVLSGEGEEPFSRLCLALGDGLSLKTVPSLTWKRDGALVQNPLAPPLDLARLPFPIRDFGQYANRILYYEAQRGCPFNCQYCLSSRDKGVRFQPLPKVFSELQRYLDAGVRQVKFVDRTFNANPSFAMAIWKYLADHDNGVTNFHFEMEGGLITREQISFLSTVRPGLFQFEIGVQSTNPATLAAVDRREDFPQVAEAVKAIRAAKNLHVHLDLIAGLPFEGLSRFGESFNDVYALEPEQFQLGFLKLLKGSGLRRDAGKYSIRWQEEAPYEVLETPALPYSDLLRLKEAEELLDLYYNSGRFRTSLRALVPLAPSPFAFYLGFGEFYRQKGYHLRPHTLIDQYGILWEYGQTLPGCDPDRLGWLLEYDLCSHEKLRKRPAWAPVSDPPERREKALDLLRRPKVRQLLSYPPETDPKQLLRLVHVGFFPFFPETGEDGACVLLFDYEKTDLLGNARMVRIG